MLREYYLKYSDEIIYDNQGSMVAHKKCKKEGAKKVLVLAHADEIGFMVSKIEKNGVVRVNPIGGIVSNTLLTNRVVLKNDEGKLFYGVVNNNVSDTVKCLEFDFGFEYVKKLFTSLFSVNKFSTFSAQGLDIYGANVDQIIEEAKANISKSLS